MPVNIEVRDGNVGKSMMQLKRTLIPIAVMLKSRIQLFKEIPSQKKRENFAIKPTMLQSV